MKQFSIVFIWWIASVSSFVTRSRQAKWTRSLSWHDERVPKLVVVTPLKLSAEDKTPLESQPYPDRTVGLLVLASVPQAWGTYGPVVKYVYEIEPAVPGIVFSAAYYVVASVVLNTLSRLSLADNVDPIDAVDRNFSRLGGLELGTYLFVANLLQVKGLETVPSGRAGFIVQLTTIMVPLISAATSNESVSLRTWIACILAFAGVVIMGLDGNEWNGSMSVASSSLWNLSRGDLLIVVSAILYSLHVVRLSRYATEITPLKLAASKASVEASLSMIFVYGLWKTNFGGPDVAIFFDALSTGWSSSTVTLSTLTPAIGAVFWTGLVTCAYTIYAQSFGQARVTPAEANLIYTIQPLFTALFAFLLLGETMGPAASAGAALIAVAVFTVANPQDSDTGDRDHNDETIA